MRQCASTGESEISDRALTQLLAVLNEEAKGGSFMEIGTAAGGTLCRLLNDWKFKCSFDCATQNWVVDTMNYFPDQKNVVRSNLCRNGIDPSHVTFVEMKSSEAFDQIFDSVDPLDFLLIDGSHKVKYVALDARWMSKVKQGGLIAFDDCDCGFIGVDWVVNYFRVYGKQNYEELLNCDGLVVFRKLCPSGGGFPLHRVWVSYLLHPVFQIITSCKKRFA